MQSEIYQICFYLYQSFSIPSIFVSNKEKIMFEFPVTDNDRKEDISQQIVESFYSEKNPELFSFSSNYFWGRVSIDYSDDFLVVGPLINNSFTTSQLSLDFVEKKNILLNIEY